MLGWMVGVVATLLASAVAAAPLEYVAYELQSEQTRPGVCLNFTGTLPRAANGLAPFVELAPRSDVALVPRGKALCVEGLVHGRDYQVRLKAGLPGSDGAVLAGDVELALRIPDRQARLVFAGKGTLLPMRAGVGLPIKSVNLPEAQLRVYKIGERNLVQQLELEIFGESLNQWGEDRLREQAGKELFRGKVQLAGKPNEEVTTAIPVADILPDLQAGLYVAVAEPGDGAAEPWDAKATQWFTISDIALQTFAGSQGMTVVARSLASAEPLAGVTLRLLARNNEPLLEIQTDAMGRAAIEASQLRGKGGQAAKLLLASRPTGELTFLELDRPALDLVELGVDGRAPPGSLDAFVWTERGIYRPGETVHLAAMLRDRLARAVPDMPLTLKLMRPDLVEVRRLLVPGGALAAGKLTIEVPANAYSGLWSVTAHVGNETTSIGRTEFLVQDFVPPRLEVAVAVLDQRPPAVGPIPVAIDARYLYGAPAGSLTGEVELSVRAAPIPFPESEGWSFGLVQEPFLPQATAPLSFTTDDKGKASLDLAPASLQETTHPLEAIVRARVLDIDGRPTGNGLEIPLQTADRFIGIRPKLTGSVPEGGNARFEVKLVDGKGAPTTPMPLSWALLAEDWDYVWFERHGRWQYENVVRDRRVAAGELALAANGEAALELPAEHGRYRLEVFDPQAITATSVRFTAGWWSAGAANDRPEKLDVTVEPGAGMVRAMIHTSFPARVLVVLADDVVRELVEVDLPKGGGVVELPAKNVGPGGAYVLVTAVSPTGAVLPRLPIRAVGAAWVAGPLAERRLELAVEAPQTIEPKRALPVTVRLANAMAGEKVQLTLAMVDDAILQMTAFEEPDPADHYLGRRALGLELRDVYGRLIDPTGQPGKVVSGGDRRLALQAAGIDVKTYKTIATMSEPLEVGVDGTVQTSFEVPDFSGRLRLMAVAWSADRVGRAEATLTVRPAMLAELTRPRFLAPGDQADIRFRLTSLGAPEGTYEVSLTTTGPLQLDRQHLTFRDVLRDKGRFANLKLTAGAEPGNGKVQIIVKGEQGVVATQEIELAVRTPQPWLTRRQLLSIAPGKILGLGTALAADMLPGTTKGEVTLSTVPAFDVPGLFADLERYPYGCTEQTVSKATPHLYVGRLLGPAAGVASADAAQRAIGRLASLEGTAGGFSPWSPGNDLEYWLTAYVADFLQQAKAAQVPVPAGLEDRTLRWLAKRFAGQQETVADASAAAYAGLVLAKAGRMDLSRLRYFALRHIDTLPSDAARIQLASALTHLGDRELGQRVAGFVGRGRLQDRKMPLLDYGTALRDEAVVLATATENGVRSKSEVLPLAERAARSAAEASYMSTQEQAWLVRAAAALADGTAALDARLGADAVTGRGPTTLALPLTASEPQLLENRAAEALYAALSVTGIPTEAGPPVSHGFEVQRRFLTTKGHLANLARLQQNDQLIALIEGKATEPGFRRVLVVDLLPAGLELENLKLAGSTEIEQFTWLGELSRPEHLALRDDRFVASLDLDSDEASFRLAYLVRAVTAGSFTLPGIQVEDMVEPGFHARGAAAQLAIAVR